MQPIEGFSKLSKEKKIDWVVKNFFDNDPNVRAELVSFWHEDAEMQKYIDEFSENTLTNFYMPFGVVPNFLINGKLFALPMVIEESSVVAAAGNSAKFWLTRGGFHATVIDTIKVGQVHFLFKGDKAAFKAIFPEIKQELLEGSAYLTANMDARGGGVLDMELVDMTEHEDGYYQLKVKFETCDSMGANFINTVLEEYAHLLKEIFTKKSEFGDVPYIILSIVSNYTPESLVRAWVECPIEALGFFGKVSPQEFADKFRMAVKIAEVDPHRATTHNKGIFNGVDALVIATGNDFRAVEACGHTYASRNGRYASLTHCSIENDTFRFWIDLPMALGTVGGLTQLHPLVKRSFQMLGNPGARELMEITAVAGLAQNFAALKSMVTVGIQQGHMKMHLLNILSHLNASEEEREAAKIYFKDKVVSYATARFFIESHRSEKRPSPTV